MVYYWKPVSQHPPMTDKETTMGGIACSEWLLVRFPHDPSDPPEVPSLGIALAVKYEDNSIDWFGPADATGGLDRCNSHGYPSVEAWCEIPKDMIMIPFTMGELWAGGEGMKCECCDKRTSTIWLNEYEYKLLPSPQAGPEAALMINTKKLGKALCDIHSPIFK